MDQRSDSCSTLTAQVSAVDSILLLSANSVPEVEVVPLAG